MSEQGLSEPENSPAVAGPDGTGQAEQEATQAEVDWQKRYLDTQSEYSRGQQELAELRQQQELYDLLLSTDDPDTRREVAEALGYELEQDEEPEPDPDADPFARYDERLGRIEEALTYNQQQELEAEQGAEIRAVLDERLDQLGIDSEDQNWVLAYAINALPPTDEGLPDIEQAYGLFREREDARQKQWAQTKRAPHFAPHGQAATEVPNLDDRQQRWEYMARRLEENAP